MTKSRKNRSRSILKSITTTSEKAIPVLDKGLTKIGSVAKSTAVKSVPVVEKGVSTIYGTLATGFNLGSKGAKTIVKRGKSVAKRLTISKRARKVGKKSKSKRM